MSLPLLRHEIPLVAALATGNQTQASARCGIHRVAFIHKMDAIIERLEAAGFDPSPIREAMRPMPQKHTRLTDLKGPAVAQVARVIDDQLWGRRKRGER